MDWLQAAFLAVLQGLTEFLPISSSAHLILLPEFADWPDQGLAFDVAVHVGTLAAVILYFRRTLGEVIADWLRSCRRRRAVGQSAVAWAVIVATVPLLVAGFALKDLAEGPLRSPLVIAATTMGFGLLLAIADRRQGTRNEAGLSWRDALLIGCAQAVAIIPGTSRSGITMTAALFLGLDRQASARFSFLLSIPAIGLAGAWKTLQLILSEGAVDWGMLIGGALLAGVTAYLTIGAFLALLDRIGFMPFVAYRVVLGMVLLLVFV